MPRTDPSEIFELEEKIGAGSYGAVYKARHKTSKKVVAAKIIPVDSDLNDLMKEVTILKGCRSDYIVRYYGSYYIEQKLWILMEYCGAGSLADMMKKSHSTLTELEISHIVAHMVLGLDYIHNTKKIHRDIKAGNVLLTESGCAKLADFGVSVQLQNTIAKRNTVIGTPFWMAPEIVDERGYNESADIWSLGITCIEMAQGQPPYYNFQPIRALFIISGKPAPTLTEPSKWSHEFNDFIACCLNKEPEKRMKTAQLLEHPFIKNQVQSVLHSDGTDKVLKEMINRFNTLIKIREKEDKKIDTSIIEPDSETLLKANTTVYSTVVKNNNTIINAAIDESDFNSETIINKNAPNKSRPSVSGCVASQPLTSTTVYNPSDTLIIHTDDSLSMYQSNTNGSVVSRASRILSRDLIDNAASVSQQPENTNNSKVQIINNNYNKPIQNSILKSSSSSTSGTVVMNNYQGNINKNDDSSIIPTQEVKPSYERQDIENEIQLNKNIQDVIYSLEKFSIKISSFPPNTLNVKSYNDYKQRYYDLIRQYDEDMKLLSDNYTREIDNCIFELKGKLN